MKNELSENPPQRGNVEFKNADGNSTMELYAAIHVDGENVPGSLPNEVQRLAEDVTKFKLLANTHNNFHTVTKRSACVGWSSLGYRHHQCG